MHSHLKQRIIQLLNLYKFISDILMRKDWNKIAIVISDVFPNKLSDTIVIKNALKLFGIKIVNEHRFEYILKANKS